MATCWIICRTDDRFNEKWTEKLDMSETLLDRAMKRVEEKAKELGVETPDIKSIECGADA